ncbi:hypothetical protein C8Q76DRAFT_791327 [Earliella scabrosa]|nr:hypothetical protein C8Q76DRAFT_791327 [Earliella scabrosa]
MIHTPERGWYFCYLPTMKLQAPDMTKNCSEEWEQLRSPCIVATACPASVGQFTSFLQQPAKQRVEVIPRITPSRIWDGFNMDIAHMSLPPPYTQALFVDLRRFIPGQSDDVALNRATVFVPTAPTLPPAGPSDYHSPTSLNVHEPARWQRPPAPFTSPPVRVLLAVHVRAGSARVGSSDSLVPPEPLPESPNSAAPQTDE